ncbi:MAG: hypothetical protein HGB14_00770 [Anaerolineaceae bacterium]|nr:hypothetical protein [Anaerolineaceae bacterium]
MFKFVKTGTKHRNAVFSLGLIAVLFIYLLTIKETGGYSQSGSGKINNIQKWELLTSDEKNNQRTVDLRDIKGNFPLEAIRTKKVLWRSEPWEEGYDESSSDSLGYPSLVKNVHGLNPDGKYYLFYAHHGSGSGIGVAISDSIEGPYKKLKDIDTRVKDSRILSPPNAGPGKPFHYSSPCVIWNDNERLWFMYFHYYKNEFDAGKGHQKTALATCSDLSKQVWEPWKDKNGELITVLPTTSERWMNSQSSYHAIQRLPDGKWLAFLRGTGGNYEIVDGKRLWHQDTCKLGFAMSDDGKRWTYFPENPIIHQLDNKGRDGVYRPHFIGYLGNEKYLLAWSESKFYDIEPLVRYGKTTDFKSVIRDTRGYARWVVADGLVSPWREGKLLYLFTGNYFHVFALNHKHNVVEEHTTTRLR